MRRPIQVLTIAGMLAAVAAGVPPLLAQEAKPAPPATEAAPAQPVPAVGRTQRDARGTGAAPTMAATATPARDNRLPPESVTRHTVTLPDRKLDFVATAGRIVLDNAAGVADAEIGYIAYTLPGREARTRPITFAINGGPGSASAWLQLGGLGPWRLPMENGAVSPSAVPDLVPNAETWLDFTDLVFIDPVGTGFSRLIASAGGTPSAQPQQFGAVSTVDVTGGGAGKRSAYYNVKGDIDSLATFIRRYLAQTNRLLSPKLLVGESYGGFRAPKIAAKLQADGGVGLNALVIVSPVLDFTWLNGTTNPMAYLDTLPAFTAAAREAKGPITRKDLADVEAYASGEYLADLMRGTRDVVAVKRMVERVTALTGLDAGLVRQRGGRIDAGTFMRESRRTTGEIVSIYDSTVGALDPFPTAPFSRAEDSFSGALAAPVTSAMVDLYATKLNWVPDGEYLVLSRAVNSAWEWGPGGRASNEAVSDLQRALALDRKLDVVVAHGMTDIITPYFRSKLIIDQIPVFGDAERLRLAVYPGGHMFYARSASRLQFRTETAATVARILEARGK